METKIGECFQIEGKWYKVVRDLKCTECAFKCTMMCRNNRCFATDRKDHKWVGFVKATDPDGLTGYRTNKE